MARGVSPDKGMKQLTIRLDDDLLREINSFAARYKYSFAESLRILLDLGVEKEKADANGF